MDGLIQAIILVIAVIFVYFSCKFIDHRININCWTWLAMFLILTTLDAVTTYILAQRIGWDMEMNTIILFMVSYFGAWKGLLLIKFISGGLLTAIVFYYGKSKSVKKLTIFAFAVYFSVVINNYLIIYTLPV